MWIFLSNSFLSIVADRHNPTNLYVRGRVRGDIERVFPDAAVKATPTGADYAFRATIRRQEVMGAIANSLIDIEYDNFKNSIKEPDRHDACMDVWTIMNKLQVARRRREVVEASAPKKGARAGKRGAPVPPENLAGWPLEVRPTRTSISVGMSVTGVSPGEIHKIISTGGGTVKREPIKSERGRLAHSDSNDPHWVHGDEP